MSLSNSTALYGALVSGEIDVLLSDGLETDQLRSLQRRAARGEFVEGTGPSVEIGYLTLLADRPPSTTPCCAGPWPSAWTGA